MIAAAIVGEWGGRSFRKTDLLCFQRPKYTHKAIDTAAPVANSCVMHRTSALKRVGHAEILASGNIRPEEDEATRIDICPATGHSDKPNRKVTIALLGRKPQTLNWPRALVHPTVQLMMCQLSSHPPFCW